MADASVPPHFHKDYRIEEKDLIPDGQVFSVVPDWVAPEGTEVTYLNTGVFRRYKMVDGTWREIGAVPTEIPTFLDIIHWHTKDGFDVYSHPSSGGSILIKDG